MNIKWSRFLKILRDKGVPFTSSIEEENIETIYLKGHYMRSCHWNKLHLLDQLAFLKVLGVKHRNPRQARWQTYQDKRKRGRA